MSPLAIRPVWIWLGCQLVLGNVPAEFASGWNDRGRPVAGSLDVAVNSDQTLGFR